MHHSEANKDMVTIPDECIIIRSMEERDIPDVINLLNLNYGDDYPDPELYDERWVKRTIYDDNVDWLVAEDICNGGILASGAVKLDYGDYDDLLGIIGRLVAHPRRRSNKLLPTGYKIVKALVSEAENKVECVIADARTETTVSQVMVEHAKLKAVGFLPNYKFFKKKAENLVIYAKLNGEGKTLRSEKLPQVIREVQPLASHVLASMDLSPALGIVDCPAYPSGSFCEFQNADRHSLGQLRRLDRGRMIDPLVFAHVSSDYGMAVLADKKVYHKMALNNQELKGAFGYKFDEHNQIFQITELVFSKAEIIAPVCAEAVATASRQQTKLSDGTMKETPARIIEVDLSAYDARIQQTFLNHGFQAVAYIPAMVFHDNSRLDVVKMIKLNQPFDSSGMQVTERAARVVALATNGFQEKGAVSV